MKKHVSVILCISAMLLLCACQQASALAHLDDYANSIMEQVGPVPTVTAPPASTPKPSYIPKVTPVPSPAAEPSPTPVPSPSVTPVPSSTPGYGLVPPPDFDVLPTLPVAATASPAVSPAPTPKPAAAASDPPVSYAPVSVPTPAATYAAKEAPIPQSVPFQVSTPAPAQVNTPAPQTAAQSGSEPEAESKQVEATPAPEAAAPAAPAEAVSSSGVTGSDVAAYAQQFVGCNYIWGGKSPDTGFDCSGLVYYVYGQFGYTLNRIAADMASNGVHVDVENIAPGDVICFYNQGSYIGHVGIYVGDGNYIHSQDSATGVVISPLSERTCKIEIRRILE